jgi:hypothetical protein
MISWPAINKLAGAALVDFVRTQRRNLMTRSDKEQEMTSFEASSVCSAVRKLCGIGCVGRLFDRKPEPNSSDVIRLELQHFADVLKLTPEEKSEPKS